jgi:uncharacterized protein YkwD
MKKKLSTISKVVVLAFSICFYISIFNINICAQSGRVKSGKSIITSANSGKFDKENFQVFNLINNERVENGLKPLLWDEETAKIAVDYSERMAAENFFSHYDSNGQSVLERAKNAKLKHWSKIGENLFSCEDIMPFESFAVKNWMKSPTHRQNILDPEWTATGIGIAESEEGEIFITQVFIRR